MVNQIIAELGRTDKPRDMEWCIENWKQSLNDARALGSSRKENRVIEAHTAMLVAWPGEKDVRELRELL